MPLQVNSPGWRVSRTATARGATRAAAAASDLPPLPREFLTPASRVAEEVVLEPVPTTRGGEAVAPRGLDLTYDLEPGQTAILAVRQRSGALTFHVPIQSTTRGARGPSQVRFQVTLRQSSATRGFISDAIKAIVVKVAKVAGDKIASFVLPRLAAALEREAWRRKGLKEGWLKVTKDTLRAGALESGTPVSPSRSLLFIHGTFSNAAAAYRNLAGSTFFDRVKSTYDDRIFAFDHFSVSRTPEENARMLLEALPEQTTTFDVITHSRGGLVLRNLVERAGQLGDLSRRFKLGRAVLVASPNNGTPLATPSRWDDTVGWMANLLEMFPDNPFTIGAEFVGNGLVWLANHASGDLPGLHSMDGDGDLIAAIQGPPGPPADAYSALVANYNPTGAALKRLLDVGIDQFFASANDLVVPSEGGWRVDRGNGTFIPAARIGCFGPGGNLQLDSVTHVGFFSHAETADFLVNGVLGRPQPLDGIDPRKDLPDRRLLRGEIADVPVARPKRRPAAAATTPAVADVTTPAIAPLQVTVVNGDLTFESEPLLLGHYRAMRLTGTEKIMDGLIGGSMTESLIVGVYPLAVGTHQIFINTRPNLERGKFIPRPAAVVVVGLGEEGKLRAADLAQTVRQAVIAWAQRLSDDTKRPPATFELAATLIGSGGTGISAADSARLVAQGVYDANVLLQATPAKSRRWPHVSRLRFVELYLDRATDAWRALRLQADATPGHYAIDDAIQAGTGPMQRPADSSYRGAEFDFISVETVKDAAGAPSIAYTLDTRRARSEVRAQRAQSKLVTELVTTASSDQNRDDQIGRTLFSLLIPPELEPYLAGSGEMQIELDLQNAQIPWELLDTASELGDGAPWAIRVKLLRKLRLKEFRANVTDADADASALIIGEQECPAGYARLPGARREALAVKTRLTEPGALDPTLVTALISSDPTEVGANARTVINAVFAKPWRIVHIAGHGQLFEPGKPGGVVLSNDTFLGPDEIRNMRVVPELVFINCCHLGAMDAKQLLRIKNPAEFASGVAGALIEIGVRCVIAAGWAVDDDAASVFADRFYEAILQGRRFVDAVSDARTAARDRSPGANTWAAYQCYGDPDWIFRRAATDANQFTAPRLEDFSGIASATSLKLALERIAVRTEYQGANVAEQLNNLRRLEELFGSKWGSHGTVAEWFGIAFVEAGDFEAGMRWYERAVAAADGHASIKAVEQLANVRGRLGWQLVDEASQRLDDLKKSEKAAGQSKKARAASRRARVDAERYLRAAVTRADDLIAQSLELLAKLIAIDPTMERADLIGSAYKRQALVDGVAGRKAAAKRALEEMRDRYRDAQDIGEKLGAADLYYPASHRLAADVALRAGSARWRHLDRDVVRVVRDSLKAKSAADPDFWSVAGEAEVDQYEALAKRRLASTRKQLEKAYLDLHKRVTARRMWSSVYDTACLVLPNYASRATGKEKAAALELLDLLRGFAHPKEE